MKSSFLCLLLLSTASLQLQAANLAFDNAAQSDYTGGWATGSNGGYGFGPWDIVTTLQDGGAAGTFTATTSGNPDLNNIATDGKAWGTYANAAGGATNGVRIVGARRDFTGGPLAVGQSFILSLENGGIQSGSFRGDNPPRTGGWVGFSFNPYPAQFPDPINAFTAITGNFGFGFAGGSTEYSVYDLSTPSGRPTGVPFTTGGLTATFTLTSASNYTLQIQTLGPGGQIYSIDGMTSGSIDFFGVFNRNAEEDDAYFNSVAVVPEPTTYALLGLGAAALFLARRRKA